MLLFIDESGHDNSGTPCEVLAGVAVAEDNLWNLVRAVRAAERDHFGDYLRHFLVDERKGKKLLKTKRFRSANRPVEIAEEDFWRRWHNRPWPRVSAAASKNGPKTRWTGPLRQQWTARLDPSCKVIWKESGDKTPRSEVDASLRDLNSGSIASRGPESFSLAHRRAARGLSSSAPAVSAQRMRTAVLAAALAIPFLQSSMSTGGATLAALEGEPAVSRHRSGQGAAARTVTASSAAAA